MAPMAEETKTSPASAPGFETKDAFHPGMYAPAGVPAADLNTTDHTYETSEAEAPASDDSAPRKTASKSTAASK